MKKNSHFILLLWQTKACQSLDIWGKGSDTDHTATSGQPMPSGTFMCKEKKKASLEISGLFWNSSHLSTPLEKNDKQWVMMVMHDFRNHSQEGPVVRMHSPLSPWMWLTHNKRLHSACNATERHTSNNIAGIGTDEITQEMETLMTRHVEYLQIEQSAWAV